MEVKTLCCGDVLWETAADYAEHCSWGAGEALAGIMRGGRFTDWERVFVAIEGDDIAGYCTLSKRDCIPDVDYTPYVSFVFVGEPYRGQRLSGRMIQCALEYAKGCGFSRVYLVSGEIGLYEKYGFVKIGEAMASYGKMAQIFSIDIS